MLKQSSLSISGVDLVARGRQVLESILRDIPGATVELECDHVPRQWDLVAHIASNGGTQTLICEARSRAWPNELHAVAYQLRAASARLPANSVFVLVAPYVSPQASATCKQLGLSWLDLAGNCDLRLEAAYIRVRGEPNPYHKGRGTASLYSPKAANVVHALLLDPNRRWRTVELAKRAGVSIGQVASVKKLLEANEWIASRYGGTTLIEPRKLLDDWSQHYKPKRKTLHFFTLDAPATLEQRIASAETDYAFTEFSAAERYSRYTRHQRVAIYVQRWGPRSSFGLRGGDGATNVTVYETGEPLQFVEEANGVRCVSPVLVYLDLKLLAGRGQDAAEYLLENVIEPRWK